MGITYANHKSFGVPEYNPEGTILYVTQLDAHVDYPEEQLQNFHHGHENFINDTIGANPTNWDVLEPGVTTVTVLEAIGNHNKVLELYDNDGGNVCSAYHAFSSDQQAGTVCFYVRKDTVSGECEISLRNGATGIVIISFENGFSYYDGGAWQPILPIVSPENTWYLVKIHFSCVDVSYMGLGADEFSVEIDGTVYGPYSFISNVDEIDAINLETNVVGSGYSVYFDAFDFSWERGSLLQRNTVQSEFVQDRNTREGWIRRGYNQQRIAIDLATGVATIDQTRPSQTAEWDRLT